jgi:hypothetical protein
LPGIHQIGVASGDQHIDVVVVVHVGHLEPSRIVHEQRPVACSDVGENAVAVVEHQRVRTAATRDERKVEIAVAIEIRRLHYAGATAAAVRAR